MKPGVLKRLSFFLASAMLLFAACKKNRLGELQTSNVTITAKYPSAYNQENASNANITLTSITDGSVKTAATNSNGEVVFADVLPGNYTISATRSLSSSEAQTLTGISTAITLNGVQNNVTIVSGQNPNFIVQLQGSALGSLVIKEVYFTGSRTPNNGTYFSDQFVEIYNNSTDTIYLDSLNIADTYGTSGLINPSSLPTLFNTDASNTYVNSIWQIPGSGREHPLAPGSSIIIAQDGVNHKDPSLNPASPVDLSAANWETYNERPDNRDADAPAVPNLSRVYFTGGFDWLLPVFGPGVIIFKSDFASLEQVAIPGASATTPPRIKVPNTVIIDGFEALKDGNSAAFKRVPAGIDAGFVFADDTYTGQSFRRKTSTTINGRRVLQDTNNSTADFEKLATPTPKGF